MRLGRRHVEPMLLGLLLALVSAHAFCVCLDFVSAIRFPYELNYGEGIVWQQAALIPGPRMYSASQALPFIVFHYPPVYYLLVHLVGHATPDLLSAGRLLSAASAVAIAGLVAGLVLTASRRPVFAIAAIAGLLVLCLHAVRLWAMFMRVDMVAVALGLAGILVAARSDQRFLGTSCALLLCVASVYCKQTQLPAGIAVFVVALLRRPGSAIGAAAVALAAGLAALAVLQHATEGGFLQNIVGYNVNRFDGHNALQAFNLERSSYLFAGVMLIGAVVSGRGLRLRSGDRATATRAMLVIYFGLATVMLGSVLKSGGSYNYFIDWLCVGCVLVGVLLGDLAGSGRQAALVTTLLIVAVVMLPWREMPDRFPQAVLDQQAALVRRIRAAEKPVASEDMTLLMRAGKPVIFEPAIVTELALVGRWNETPLVDMIRAKAFAFMITTDEDPNDTTRRSPAVDAAMRAAYPVVEKVAPMIWFNLPE